MADDIFVGSVSVGVVPDLRGFNDRMRAELVPAANRIGQDMGKEMTKGIIAGLDFPKIVKDATPKATVAARTMGREMGKELTKGVADTFDIGKIIVDATRKAKPVARLAGKDLGDTYGRAFRQGLDDALKGIKAKVDVDLNKASLARAKAEIRDSLGGGVNVNLGGGRGGGGGGGSGGTAEAAAGGGFIGGINALIKALPGGTSGSISAVPTPVLIGAGAVAAAVLPFLGQMLAGVIPALGGGAITGLGIAGAFGVGGTTQAQVAQARAAAQAANARVRAAQARLAGLGGGGPTGLATTAAADTLAAAQARLSTARGGTSASAILSAEASVASAQDRINKLRSTGKASTAQLAAAEASLSSARAAQSKASLAYQTAQKDQITASQEAVRQSFKNLAQDAKQSLSEIGAPMAPVMKNILDTVDKTMKFLTPIFKGAVATISGPFEVFSDTIIKSFKDPQVTSSIQAVTKAFTDVMKAFTPDIPGIINSFADAIERIASSVSKNPKAFADFLNFVFQLGIMLLNAVAFLSDFATDIEKLFGLINHVVIQQWNLMWSDIVTRTVLANRHLEQLISDWLHNIAHWFDIGRHWVASTWNDMYNDTIGAAIRQQRHLEQLISDGLHNIANLYDIFRHDVASIWDTVWNNTIGRAERGYADLMGLFHRLKTDINNWFLNAGTWLTNVGHDIIQGMLNGMKNAMNNIGGWVKSVIVDPIVNWVKHHFGIASPSTLMAGLGINLIEGLLKGLMNSAPNVGRVVLKIFGSIPNALGAIVGKGLIALEKLPASALKLLGGLGGKIGHFFSNLFHGGPAGAGVQRWAPTVLQALGMLHLPSSLLPQVLYQMQTESGGNPNAINLTDINAQHGDPSRGLLQTIGSTFAAYHVPGTSSNIYDPLANIAAAINYAVHTYGPSLMRGGMGMGSGHGYALGTGGAAPGWAWVGERGPELVNFMGGETVVPTGGLMGFANGTVSAAEALAAHNRALIAAATASRRASAAAIAAYNKMVSVGTSLAATLAKITPKTTASVFATDQAKFLADLRLYFSPSVAKARSLLVISQIKELQNLQAHMKTLSTNIANATAFQTQELAHLQSTGGIGAIGIQGVGAAGGRSILSGLTSQLTNMRNFGYAVRDLSRAGGSQALLKTVAAMDPASGTVYARKMISALNKMHAMKLAPEMINQLVALGPDAALAYVNAIQAAGPSVLKQVKSTEAALASATLGTSRGIASVVSGGAYNTGANFIAGLKSQQSALDAQFKHLGKTLGEEAIKWMHVPANRRPYGYAGGGWINEPVSGVGMYTGAFYTFAEQGREYVLPEGQAGARGGDGDSYHAHFDGLTGAAIESHVRIAFKAMSFQQGALNRAGRRS